MAITGNCRTKVMVTPFIFKEVEKIVFDVSYNEVLIKDVVDFYLEVFHIVEGTY